MHSNELEKPICLLSISLSRAEELYLVIQMEVRYRTFFSGVNITPFDYLDCPPNLKNKKSKRQCGMESRLVRK